MPKAIDLSGKRFGRLFVACRIGSHHGRAYFKCLCDCGETAEVLGKNLSNGRTTSCGCYSRELATKHGLHKAEEYSAWVQMRHRCRNPRTPNYARYGGRGISVCERWNDFAAFIADMGPRPSPEHSIDRIDNDGNYEPGNCRWATRREQGGNTSRNVLVEVGGRRMTISELARELGMHRASVRLRIKRGTPSLGSPSRRSKTPDPTSG